MMMMVLYLYLFTFISVKLRTCGYRGKFGNVCLCTELSSRAIFAAKFIRVRASQREEFRQEIAVMNLLRHPKILLLWDAFESSREIILVMEQSVTFTLPCRGLGLVGLALYLVD